MSKRKKVLLMLLKGGFSQAEIAAVQHVSKREVTACARVAREKGLTHEAVFAMDPAKVDELFPRAKRKPNADYLQPDLPALVERKLKNRKLPVKLIWAEYCELAAHEGKLAYSYQTFCQMFANEAERAGAKRHFVHEPGAKAYIDWAGDTARVTDRITGAVTKIYVLVVCLPFSDKFWAEGFTDMKQRSWQEGQRHAFERFGGVPKMLVPDNAATATDRSAWGVTLINTEYQRFAEHYGAVVVPARVRKPRDKSVSESTVDLIERWIIAPATEQRFYTLAEFNEFCAERVAWLNERPFSAKEGSRDVVFEAEEREQLLALPKEPYEMCEWRSAKVAPDYHITIDYMRYSVPHTLIGEQLDVRLTDSSVTILRAGEIVAEHIRLKGKKGQYSTVVDHMPASHAAMGSPWSIERFESWAKAIGPECACAISHVIASVPIAEQSLVPCRNILNLSKSYGADLLERACAKSNANGATPSLTSLKNAIQAIKAEDAEARSCAAASTAGPTLIDRAKSAGRLRGADAYRRGGESRA